jgi:hypothetical protein
MFRLAAALRLCRTEYGGADEYETAEEYAQRIWEEMLARRQAQRGAEMAAFRRRRYVGGQ